MLCLATPFGVLPILEFEGNQITGSMNIARYLAEKHGKNKGRACIVASLMVILFMISGLAGDNDLTNAKLFGLVDAIQDAFRIFALPFMEKDEVKKVLLLSSY